MKVVARPSDEETTLHNKIDLLMGLVQDMAPVVKTLQESHEASLLYDEDEDVPVESASDGGEHEVDEPPSKRPKSYLGTQSSSPKIQVFKQPIAYTNSCQPRDLGHCQEADT